MILSVFFPFQHWTFKEITVLIYVNHIHTKFFPVAVFFPST